MNKYELYYQVAHSHLAEQDVRNQGLELKASASIGLSATMLGLAGLTVAHWGQWSFVPAAIMLAAFIVVMGASVLMLWARKWHRSPTLATLYDHLPNYDDEGLISWTANEFSSSIDHNDQLLDGKATRLKVVLAALYVEGMALGVLVLSTNLP